MIIININIRKIMEEKGVTPRDVEKYMNISYRTIYRIFENKRVPNLLELLEFSMVLDVPIEDLYTIVKEEEEEEEEDDE